MYYHVIAEINEKVGKSGNNKEISELNKTDITVIEDEIITPFLQDKRFQIDGHFLQSGQIKRLVVKQTEKTADELVKYEYDHMAEGVFMMISGADVVEYEKHSVDITKELIKNAESKISNPEPAGKKVSAMDYGKVFIVHGHEEAMKVSVARFIEKIGFEPIILHEQASSGMTIIEKIESYTNVGFGVVLYSPCDLGGKNVASSVQRGRARQNVVFEHGYLIAKLQRNNVCALVKGDVETPNDISGVVYVAFDEHEAWKMKLAKEMKNSGYQIDMNDVI